MVGGSGADLFRDGIFDLDFADMAVGVLGWLKFAEMNSGFMVFVPFFWKTAIYMKSKNRCPFRDTGRISMG